MGKEYNVWTNYATWRVNLDIIDRIEFEVETSSEDIKEIVEDVVFSQYELGNGSHLVEDYARAFISQVNCYKIAESINKKLDEQD